MKGRVEQAIPMVVEEVGAYLRPVLGLQGEGVGHQAVEVVLVAECRQAVGRALVEAAHRKGLTLVAVRPLVGPGR
ncbi:MAG: hypothetical protein GY773_03645, partial [Actinomycetia bacterium]|nr:hypothetical protein [Actinomycetes bacterium]